MEITAELISIALCTYNGEAYLAEQLLSLTRQTYKNIEIVIVDDSSSDHTVSIIRNFQAADSRIKLYCNEQNLGFNANFKKAISLCTAKYVAIADQDDIWMEDKLSIMMAKIGDNLLCYHNSAYINDQGTVSGKSTLSAHRFTEGFCSNLLVLNNCVSGHACLIRKELLDQASPFPQDLYYDWWLSYTAACQGRITFTTETLVHYRLHNNSITRADKKHSKALRIQNFRYFRDHSLTPPNVSLFLSSLLYQYKKSESRFFSLPLFTMLLKNYAVLFYTRKRSLFSNLRFIFRESIN
ncbi:Glycosyltransferase involved in cell wall bisynthesis [Pedobacter westerhofensis]|uniref:Glycosyltransferase involved in cell wall bisynthesis n=1 Tax=Pedobacter westerhofensis TaxID=425512 RepID=A0A521F6H5_9SPHI|nr:glycosyltransferase [Pedobacter westerhofensis]SMO91782.1 Glycosyltransferase involved in cell wall bisynthesis [Pedobacter westerhofensis]